MNGTDQEREKPIAEFQKIRLAYDEGRNGEKLPADHGNFSEGFYKRVGAALRMVPGVVEHIVNMVIVAGGAEDRVDGSRDAPLPMSTQAFADANEIYSRLVYWARVFATELHVQAPGPAVRAWRNTRGTIVGLPNGITAQKAGYEAGVMATWLNMHLELICENVAPDDVVAFESGDDSGVKFVFQANARWPQKARPRYSDMPCPKQECKGRISVYPPNKFGDDEKIMCESCGQWYPPEQYEHLIGVFKQVRSEKRAVEKVRNHLLKKYGNIA